MKRQRTGVACCAAALILAAVVAVYATEPNTSAWWPQFHGANRDNISRETGLLQEWPEGGPELIWRFSGCGSGYSGVSIADGKIFTAGDSEGDEFLVALDMDGQLLWRAHNGKSWNGPHPGSRTTPTYDNGRLYHLNPTGRLASYEAATGREIWSVDLVSKFGGRYGTWAMAENVVVDGDLVFCVPGGTKGLMVALNKTTGRTVWTSTELDEVAAYCSPLIVSYRGVRQLITMAQKSVISVDVQSGKLLWSYPHVTPHDQNVTMPVFHDGYVFVSSGHKAGGRLLKIGPDQHSVSQVWYRQDFDNCHGGVILVDGRLYGSGCRTGGKRLICADFLTGDVTYVEKTLDKLSLTYADGRLYGLSHRGRMVLLEPVEGKVNTVSQFAVPRGDRNPFFAHPVVCGGRLYVRHGPNLYAYNVKAKPISNEK